MSYRILLILQKVQSTIIMDIIILQINMGHIAELFFGDKH